MEQISTYSISRLQKALELSAEHKDYFFIEIGREPIYTDEPFRTVTHTLLLLKKGEICLNAGLVSHLVKAPALIALSPTVTRSFTRTMLKPEMEVIFFTEQFLLEELSDVFFLNRFSFLEDNERHVFQLEEAQLKVLALLFGQVSGSLKASGLNQRAILRHLICTLLYQSQAYHLASDTAADHKSLRSPLFQRFRKLLTQDFLRQRAVNYYADALNVSPKYLSEVSKRDSGLTAGEWIDQAVMLEAKVLLQNRSLSIAQISEYLNFSDQSFFGKYFKNLHGSSPLDYRRSLDREL